MTASGDDHPQNTGPKVQAKRVHLCACADPTAHADLLATVGAAYVAVRQSTFKTVIKMLRLAQIQVGVYREDNVHLARELARLRSSVEGELDLTVKSPAFEGGLGGRTAIGHYRNTNLAAFIQHMNEAGKFALVGRQDVARFFLSSAVKADAECLWAAAPATAEELIRRRRVRRWLSNDEFLDRLSGASESCEQSRRRFIVRFLSSGVDTSVQELVRRSGDMSGEPKRDRPFPSERPADE